MSLLNYRKNYLSQHGEDGILEYIFTAIAETLPDEKWCVEFGAWDGKYLSNTFHLIENGWNGVYIEADKNKFKDLKVTAEYYKKIVPLNAMVGFDTNSKDNLDNLLKNTDIPSDFELLSIDIDSYDLAVWAAYSGKPKVVVIEVNSFISPGILQWHDGNNQMGNSFSSTLNVAKQKGYSLACHTGNMIFVRNELVSYLKMNKMDLEFPERLFLSAWTENTDRNTPSALSFAKKLLPNGLKKAAKSLIES